jgi:uncharacterized protein (DUF983 family)
MIVDLLKRRCPVCRKGAVFRGLYAMNELCPSCGIKFERESGYFLGALVIAYVMGVATVIPTVILLVRHFEAEIPIVVLIPSLQLLLLHPVLYIYSRMAWLYFDRAANPKGWT